jgi:RNA polymerase sigma-B factor
VASDVGRPLEEVLEAMQAGDAYTAVSLDSPLRIDQEDVTVADSLGETDERLELAEHRPAITDALNALPERERSIVYLRFVKDLTQTEIAERLGISQMHVSRLIRTALERMRVLVDDRSPRGDGCRRSEVDPEHSSRRRFDEAA